MPIVKITESQRTDSINDNASVLVTQPESVDGVETEALRRADLKAFIEVLKNNGLMTSDAFKALVKDVEATDTGVKVTFRDDTTKDIDIMPDKLKKLEDGVSGAMQTSVYDKIGRKADIYDYAANKADAVAKDLNAYKQTVAKEISDAYRFTKGVVYPDLAGALAGAVEQSKSYTQAALTDYKAFTVVTVDELPLVGEERVFYLLPKDGRDGYDKYWWITDADGKAKWDVFGSSSTVIVTALPETGDIDVDYILKTEAGCMYYKWIEGAWEVVAGSLATVVTALPETGNEYTDYYVQNENGTFSHYRYIDGGFKTIGSESYTKNELDAILASRVDDKLKDIDSRLNAQQGNIERVETVVDNLGSMVSDVTETENGIKIHFGTGETKSVSTKDTAVKVEDVNKSEDGISVVYTDGSTKDIAISGGGGSVATGSASIIRITPSSTQCVYGDSCPISYTFNAIDSAGDMVGDGTATWYVGNIKKATSIAYQGDNTFDIGKYLNVGSNNVKVSISVDTGGETPTVTTKTWSVNAINMYVNWDYDDTTVNESETIALRWTPYGDLSKTTHITIDGEEVYTADTTRSGVQQYAIINKYPHGSHLTEIYLTATVSGQTIRSNSVFHDIIFAEAGNSTPIISCSLSEYEVTQYNTLPIPVVIYNPSSLTANAVLKVDGVEAAKWTGVDRTVHYWNYTPSDFGEKVLSIECGGTVKTIHLTVSQLNINNEEISGYAFKLKASDIAGNDALKAWSSNGVDITFSDNFDWNNGGIQTELDDNGNVRQFICVKAGTTATINYELFGNEAKVNGKNFKVIFKALNVRDYDAKILRCIDSGIGIELGANNGTASSEQNSVDVQYQENSYVEFEYDIRPDSSFRYIQTYLDGVLSSTKVYSPDDNFTQTNKQKIVIGSPDCDVNIYLVKAYETYLNMDNHIENFIADAPNAQEMVLRYERNDILSDSGEISYEKLAEKNPECRVHLWDVPRMTQGKKDYVEGCHYQQIYKAGDVRHQITADNVRISIQGTSSVNYKDSGANTDGNFTEGFTDGNGQHIDGYSMEDNSIPVNYFNTKVNIASCENINNKCLAEWYNRFQPYKTKWRQKNPLARDCMEHHMGVQFIKDQSHVLFPDDNYHMYAICNMGNSKKNLEVFHDKDNLLECCIETLDNNSTHCLMLDSSFSVANLDSEDFFEFRYPDAPTDDMKQAFVSFVQWMASCNPNAATNAALPSAVTYGAYTFKGTGQEGEVLAGLTIDEYAGTYTHDTYEYRMAKMLDECEDHLVMDAMVFHYVFVEQHTMVDNVCKNTFWGTEDLVHWQLAKNYDNDTADGNNNTGKLVIPFGCEGMDTLGDGDVFNGKTSVWWVFVNGLYEARRAMWINRESAGAWDSKAYLDFAKGEQDIIPERVYNQDYWYKYLRLYETNGVTTYIPMLEGGKKTHQRESFVTNNELYMAGQYMGTACTSRSITLRGYTPSEWQGVQPKSEVSVQLYNKGYIVVQIGSIYKRQKAEKGQFYTITFTDSGDMNDTVINIHGANLVQAVGDISCLYVGRSDFSAGTRLRSITIGSTAEGYRNNNLSEIGFGTNTMLEELYVQNCPNVKATLDLSGCQALRKIDARGSGFTGFIFAVGGLLEEALLGSPASINMRSLYSLSDEKFSLESYENLSTIRMEQCPGIDSLALVNRAVNLARLRLLGIDWAIAETDVLNRLLKLAGLDENDHNLEIDPEKPQSGSVLTGEVLVSGAIRNQELNNYAARWTELKINYDPQNLVTQYLATYVNQDGTVLYTAYVDRGITPPDPVAEGLIPAPTMPSTEQYIFTYNGWDDISSAMLSPRTITATYTETVREYTVTWYSRIGLPLETKKAVYGTEAIYEGGLPTNLSEEDAYIYNVFVGWDKSTGFIRENTDVYAIWERAELPATTKELKDMSCAEVCGICTARLADSYFQDKDHIDINLGSDFTFSNVEEKTILENRFFDGTEYYDTNIKLFDADSPSFTLAIDYEFLSSNPIGATLVSCFEENGNEGFRLRYSGSPNIQWGDKEATVGYGANRNIVVLRHVKGSDTLFAYAFNTENTTYALSITTNEMIRARSTATEQVLSFGAVKFLGDGGHDEYAKGWIHWCKIWYDDLGKVACEKLASWPHEILRMEFAGPDRYRLAGAISQRANGSFLANNMLPLLRRINPTDTNAGGWDACEIRKFLNTRFYEALPYKWQAVIKKVKVNASAGGQSNEILVSEDYIYLASNREVGGWIDPPYINEGDAISFFTSNESRLKFPGLIISENAQFITNSSDPSQLTIYSIKEGDIWINTSQGSIGYYYLSAETIAKHSRIGYRDISSSDNIPAANGGCWIRANCWWQRSTSKSSSTLCIDVYQDGSPYGSYFGFASDPLGIVIGISI